MKDMQMLRKALWIFIRPLIQLIQNLLSPEKGEEWLKEFNRFLRKEPCWVSKTPSFIEKTFASQTVDYDRSVEDSVKAGEYDCRDGDITDENFPSEKSGKSEVNFATFYFDNSISSEDAIELMKLGNYRPATMKEELAFGEKNPDEQRQHPVVALGSVVDLSGDRHVGVLYRDGSGRGANLVYYGHEWNSRCRFLAVRN